MSVASKIVGKAILNRLKHVLDTQLEENQCGFHPKRGCCDQIYVARMLIQKAREFNRPLYFCFIDLQKAYDSINREALWQSLRRSFSIPEKIIRILQALHHNTTGIVRAEEQTSEKFPINVGVKQEDVFAPVLFNFFFDAVTQVAMNKHPDKGVSLEYCDDAPILFNYRHKLNQKIMIQSLAYADDIVLVSSNLDDLNCLVQTVSQTFNNFGIQLNLAKTNYMHMTPESTQSITHPKPMNIEKVNSFKYLGSILSNKSSIAEDINNRLSKASKVFRGLNGLIWYKTSIRLETKIKLFRSIILSILLYDSEAWCPVSSQIQRLQVFVTRRLRIITGIFLWQKVKNTELRRMTSIERVEDLIKQRRLRWLGHLQRMENNRIPKKLLSARMRGNKRTQGGQKLRWNEVINKDL